MIKAQKIYSLEPTLINCLIHFNLSTFQALWKMSYRYKDFYIPLTFFHKTTILCQTSKYCFFFFILSLTCSSNSVNDNWKASLIWWTSLHFYTTTLVREWLPRPSQVHNMFWTRNPLAECDTQFHCAHCVTYF